MIENMVSMGATGRDVVDMWRVHETKREGSRSRRKKPLPSDFFLIEDNGTAGDQDPIRDHQGSKAMRNREEKDADVEARIALIEQMTLEQIAMFQARILADITKGRITTPREASALDRALRKRLKVIEQELRRA